jgi:hypothetical protein
LISYGEVGLPFYRLLIRAEFLEHRAIGPSSEFLLKAVSAGIDQPDHIGQLLGLSGRVLDAAIVELVASDDLHLVRKSDTLGSSLILTPKGERTLKTLISSAPEERAIEIDYDALLRRPVPFLDDWVMPIDLRNSGAREVPPAVTKPPDIHQIRLDAVDKILRALGDRREAKRDLLALKAIDRRRRVFQVAVALFYRSNDDGQIQAAFSIDGQLSIEHEKAFSKSKLLRKLGVSMEGLEPAERAIAQLIGTKFIEEANRNRSYDGFAPAVGVTDNSAQLQEDLSSAPENAREPAEISPVFSVETYEHPGYLRVALSEARSRLLIVSPWVRQAVVDRSFLEQLEGRLANGATVYIGWGIGRLEMDDEDIDPQVSREFDRLQKRYTSTFFPKRLGNTHAKILICDQRFMVVTSFNWLSFKGDPNRTFRDERGIGVSILQEIEQQFDDLLRRFLNEEHAPKKATRRAAANTARPLSPRKETGPESGMKADPASEAHITLRGKRVGEAVLFRWTQVPPNTQQLRFQIQDSSGTVVSAKTLAATLREVEIDQLRGVPQPIKVKLTATDASGQTITEAGGFMDLRKNR